MNKIKIVLSQKGLTQIWLSKSLNKSYNMVNAYTQNRQQPRLEVLYEIATLLDVEVSDLLYSRKEIINLDVTIKID